MDWKFPSGSQIPEWPSDAWTDPHAEREVLRNRLRRARFGFSVLGLALVVASLSTIGFLILGFSGVGQPLGILLGIPNFELIEGSIIVWGSLLGVALLVGGWPDESWRGRSVLLLLMCLVDATLWSLDHADLLGLRDGGDVPHAWLRRSLGEAISWSEFALIASLAADMAAHLGETRAIDFARSVRSLATTGAMVWFLYFYFRTNWVLPIWPLRARPQNHGSFMLMLCWMVLSAILFVQTTALSLLAGRCCGQALRKMAAEDRASDLLPSRSEAGWDELLGPPSEPKRNG
jgi:hypothetical protein